MMEEMGTKAADYTYAVFHQPNTNFPQRAAEATGLSAEEFPRMQKAVVTLRDNLVKAARGRG